MWLVGLIASALFGMVLREVIGHHARAAAPWLVGRAVRRLPPARRVVREEEWIAQVDELLTRSEPFLAVWFAVGTVIGAQRTALRDRRKRRENYTPEMRAKIDQIRVRLVWLTMVQSAIGLPIGVVLLAQLGPPTALNVIAVVFALPFGITLGAMCTSLRGTSRAELQTIYARARRVWPR